MEYVNIADLSVSRNIFDFVNNEMIPGSGVSSDDFWQSLNDIVYQLGAENRRLLDRRVELRSKIDEWMKARKAKPGDPVHHVKFLYDIGYLVPEGEDFKVDVQNVDDEIATMAGPQLVVPVQNARYALNATNARWGSLYDALYGTDALTPVNPEARGYDRERGHQVVEYAKNFLDQCFPLSGLKYGQVTSIEIDATDGDRHPVFSGEGQRARLEDETQFAGYREHEGALTEVILVNNGLHVRICIDRDHMIGKHDAAGIKDMVMESAVTTIQDFEDSTAAVDAEDKELVYRNWFGLMKGDLEAEVSKGGKQFTRRLNSDIHYVDQRGVQRSLKGRSLLFVRNVGIHMYTDLIRDWDGGDVPEGFADAMICALAAKHDLLSRSAERNSVEGSIYLVKPKLHGPEEVAFTVSLLEKVEEALGLEENTIKIGIMDEERRTTLNLKECIRAARNRVVFINTGFLDRTGDEIHTWMHAGAMVPKPDLKSATWLAAYEDWNVDIGLETGLSGSAQIGKGMWAMPDEMKAMLDAKIGHPEAGASTAWVPSPTAATLHAMHYHHVNVFEEQARISERQRASLGDLLTPPLLGERQLSPEQIQQELDNNAQGILGYVVRWIGQGIGCSKVPDINDIGLMEDRATLRISSQHIANWLLHRMITKDQLVETMERMAVVVDRQNHGDPNYRNMAPDFDNSIEFQAAMNLVLKGTRVPNGYTEHVLHRFRAKFKQRPQAKAA